MFQRFVRPLFIASSLVILTHSSFADDTKNWQHATSLVGSPKYQQGFSHFDYVNVNAPKGGNLRLSETGSFDTINPATAKGEIATGLGLVLETLIVSSLDEISSDYGLLAEAFSHPEDYSSVTYLLRDKARWHDGMPVTPEDVIFSFESAIANDPKRKNYYKHVISAEKTGEREVTFKFDEKNNRELPHIVGQILVHPKHWWEAKNASGEQRDISRTTLEPIMGSGPYRISQISPGSSVTFERVKNYWGEDLNVNIGQNNFDKISYSYFSDRNVEFEAFKANDIDYWVENEAKRWATGYDFPAANEGKIKREQLANAYRSSGIMLGFIPNQRREIFKDQRVRRALNLAYDFEEQNRTLFYDAYKRIDSYFFGSELASSGLPEGLELDILEELRNEIPESIFTEEYRNPIAGTPQKARANLREAIKLFKEAGYETRKGKMVNAKTGEPFTFEIILNGPIIEKVALPYAQSLKKIGIDVSVRSIDPSQWVNRWRERDYDMIYYGWAQSLSPGNEQIGYWGSDAVDQSASGNYAGISNPAIDKLIQKIIFAENRDELVATTKALDRVLLANDYIIPSYTIRASRIAYWDKFERLDELPKYSIGFPTVWWSKSAE
ncbi:extracellular solute-binding protein [Lentilitoribacter sp. EG35]|uniref:extracellular solute-binding protein n=1 Tax=Lentilitoribacter sp. EG35 TaxID=3234192 RepID=UPI0034600F78